MFKVRPFEAKTLSWWFGERENIDESPPYQRRGGLWSARDKAYLIDSIINGYDIPKLYIADFTFSNSPLNNARKQYAVIDGRQRIEAIFDFFTGQLTLAPDFLYDADPGLKLAGLSYKDLKSQYPRVASIFDNFNLSVMSVITDDESKINELFVRLNRSKPLTPAEIRHAMEGQIPELIRDLADHHFFADRIRFSTNRRQNNNVATKLLLIEFRGKFVDTKRIQIDRFVQEGIRAENPSFNGAAKHVELVLERMLQVFAPRDPLLRSEGPVPLYYWLVRNAADEALPFLREFLVRFEAERIANRNRAENEDAAVDEEMIEFDRYRRSINDQGSLTGMYEILERRFTTFLENRGVAVKSATML
jgi:hypothetical protein